MTHRIYVDVPADYNYNWNENDNCSRVLSDAFGYPFIFFVNSGANISEGDCFKVELKDEEDEVFFFLKTGFKKVDTKLVEGYLLRSNRK